MMESFNLKALIFTILVSILSDFGESVNTFKKCCSAGKEAGNGLVNRGYSLCNKKPNGLDRSPTKMCTSLYKICCYGGERKKACVRGELYAKFPKDNFSCMKSSERNTMHGSTFLECCECCGMGNLAGRKKNSTCRPAISLNKTCDDIYQRCCKRIRATSGPKKCSDIECDQVCKESSVGARCSCQFGYKLMNDSKTCKDVDECSLGTHRCIPKNFNCINLSGSYRCDRKKGLIECPKGYIQHDTYCRDEDECAAGKANCPANTVCENVLGSYHCAKGSKKPKCPKGYYTINSRCIDVNECRLRKPCKVGERCINTFGSYKCELIKCQKGYEFINKSCRDINECQRGTHTCKGAGEKCINYVGRYRCVCNRGFRRVGYNCVDFNECQHYGKRLCNHKCVNLPGTFRCECLKGFSLGRNKRTCLDINECRTRRTEHPCPDGHRCYNSPGTYKCILRDCPAHYLQKSYRSCKLNCKFGIDCSKLPVSIKWYAVSRQGPIRKNRFRFIYAVDLSDIRGVKSVAFQLKKGNEKGHFSVKSIGLYGSKALIYNSEDLKESAQYSLRLFGTVKKSETVKIYFEYDLYVFIFVPK